MFISISKQLAAAILLFGLAAPAMAQPRYHRAYVRPVHHRQWVAGHSWHHHYYAGHWR